MNARQRYKEVDGWLTDAEAAELQRLAENQVVLEIGTWKGRSTIAMAATARRVIAIDHFYGDGYAGKAFTLPEAVQNIHDKGVRDKVNLCCGSYVDILPHLNMTKFGLVLYDADHTYDATITALRLIVPKVLPGTPVAVHDYEPAAYPQVVKACQEIISECKGSVTIVDRLGILTCWP